MESKGLKVNTTKTKVMVSGSEGELFKSKIDPCGVGGRRVMANSVCKGIMEGTVDLNEKLCDKVETVNGFCYLGDRPNSSGDCEAAVAARIRIGWVRFREYGELLLGNRFPLRMKGKVYRLCVRSAVLYGSEAW